MKGRVFTALVMGFLAITSMPIRAQPNTPVRFTIVNDFCDVGEGAPISERCIGFVAAIVEMRRDEKIFHNSHQMDVCIPWGIKTTTVVKAIRPWLRQWGGICAGYCDASSYISGALNATYPCKR